MVFSQPGRLFREARTARTKVLPEVLWAFGNDRLQGAAEESGIRRAAADAPNPVS
jgi:hypothetical protein